MGVVYLAARAAERKENVEEEQDFQPAHRLLQREEGERRGGENEKDALVRDN